MSPRPARIIAALYVLIAAAAVTWPGIVPFAKAYPLVLGLPYSMAWIAAWVAGFAIVFALLDMVERRHRGGSE